MSYPLTVPCTPPLSCQWLTTPSTKSLHLWVCRQIIIDYYHSVTRDQGESLFMYELIRCFLSSDKNHPRSFVLKITARNNLSIREKKTHRHPLVSLASIVKWKETRTIYTMREAREGVTRIGSPEMRHKSRKMFMMSISCLFCCCHWLAFLSLRFNSFSIFRFPSLTLSNGKFNFREEIFTQRLKRFFTLSIGSGAAFGE